MLQKLVIRNYAIIDHLTLTPDRGLNTVTGETGAGKSIILGALSLILGDRADTGVLINKSEKCVVEGHFDISGNAGFQAALRAAELDDESPCIIRREIGVSGKSRAFVADTPVNLTLLNQLTAQLVDLHQQFDHLALENDSFGLEVLDAIGGNAAQLEEYRTEYSAYRRIATELATARDRQAGWQKEADYKQFLLDELVQVSFRPGEVEEADAQLKSLSHAERIKGVLEGARYTLEEGEQPLVQSVRKMVQSLQSIADVQPAVAPLAERLQSAHAELKDICGEIGDLESRTTLDAGEMDRLQERIDLGYRLFKKHAVNDTAGLLAIQAQLDAELQETLNLTDRIAALTAEETAAAGRVKALARKLTASRTKVAPKIAERVTALLALVGMPNARFRIDVRPLTVPGAAGEDMVVLLLDANRSDNFQPLHKAASGGEMSRIMLSIKSLTAEAVSLPTLIFDEVDTGISGEAARQVAALLRKLAEYHQVICITHQPQVAARGSRHFYVFKEENGTGRITTRVRELDTDERVRSIARMIGGEQPSPAAVQNARELMEQ